MKKTILPFVIAALPFSAQAEVIIYGKANVSFQNADEGGESTTELVSNASRIGLKGSEQINDGLKAIYQFEYQTEVDDGAGGSSNQTFTQRNIYLGLQGNFGTLMGGKFDTPLKNTQEKVDLFNDLEGDIGFLVRGETRPGNIVQYSSPLLANAFAINIAHVSAEDPDLDDGMSASLTYTSSAFYAAIGAEQDVTAQGLDILRAVARYTIGDWQLGALVEQAENTDADTKNDSWLASVKYALTDKWALKAQYGDAARDVINNNLLTNVDAEQLSVGVDYSLSKNAMIFAYYTSENTETAAVETADDSWLGVGAELKF
jgi:predicted porin